MDIKILGSGCAKCQTLERVTHEAVDQLGLEAEFEKVTDPGEIDNVSDRLREVLSDPIPLDELDIPVSASIGTAVATPGTITPRDLIRQADAAMYADKETRRRRSLPSAV